MTEFWELNFREKQTIWGLNASKTAIEAADFFKQQGLKKILIPGYGYGRNASAFSDKTFEVTGIELSSTAIALAKQNYGSNLNVHLGSVNSMPFDQEIFDGIFCYGLIHLLDKEDRIQFLQNCYQQLRPGGYLVFVAVSTNSPAYGRGKELEKNTFFTPHGIRIFYYDIEALNKEFSDFDLIESKEITESSHQFWQALCQKPFLKT